MSPDSVRKAVEDAFAGDAFKEAVENTFAGDAFKEAVNDALDDRLSGIENALVFVAQKLPGATPGTESHVTRKVRELMD